MHARQWGLFYKYTLLHGTDLELEWGDFIVVLIYIGINPWTQMHGYCSCSLTPPH